MQYKLSDLINGINLKCQKIVKFQPLDYFGGKKCICPLLYIYRYNFFYRSTLHQEEQIHMKYYYYYYYFDREREFITPGLQHIHNEVKCFGSLIRNIGLIMEIPKYLWEGEIKRGGILEYTEFPTG